MPVTRLPSRFALRLGALAALACCACAQAQVASPADSPSFTVSGFGTLGVVHKSDRQSDYVRSPLSPNGAGASRTTSLNPDTRLGVQLDAQAGKWSGVLQLVTEQQTSNSWVPIVEWANIKYQATPDLALRVGRIALPLYLAADYRKVGYAYPWVRTPVEVYGGVPISNSDGVDLSYRWNHGDVKHTTQLIAGRNDHLVTATSRLHARRLMGLADTATWGAATLRVSYLATELSVDLAREGFETYRQLGPAGVAVAERWDVDHKRATAASVGLAYDPGNWFAQGELGQLRTRSYLGDRNSLYLTAGLRQDAWTPYAAFAATRPLGATFETGVPLASLPPAARPVAAYLTGELNGMLRYVPDQNTLSLGLRWDARDSVAVKFQVDRVQPRGQSFGTLIKIQPGFQPGQPLTVASATLDFVF